jgi:hypothetical protein
MTTIKLGDIGSVITATIEENGVAIDVSSATTKLIYFLKPFGGRITKEASFDTTGTDGKVKYAIIDGICNQAGYWQAKFHIKTASGQWTTDPIYFLVEAS